MEDVKLMSFWLMRLRTNTACQVFQTDFSFIFHSAHGNKVMQMAAM